MICLPAVLTARADELSFTFEFEPPLIEEAGEYNRVTMEGCELWRITGRPVIPFTLNCLRIGSGIGLDDQE